MNFSSIFVNKKRRPITNTNYEKTLFLNLFSDWLIDAKKDILTKDGFISKKAIKLSFNSLYDILIKISERVLFVEYNVFLEDIQITKRPDVEKLKEFEKKLLDVVYRKYLLDEYPEFFRLVFKNINYFINNINEIISSFIKDFDRIKAKFNFENSEIEYIRMGLGDRHNKNKTTSLLKIKNESFIIFKPRDLTVELCFSNFLNYYNYSCNTNIYLPKILFRKRYSWVEFVEHSNKKKNKDSLFEEIGHILCILYFLNGTDFHYENIIFNEKKGLVLIDCESLLYPIINTKMNEHNVLSIGLLSNKINIGDQQVDFGGLNISESNNVIQEFPTLQETISIKDGKILSHEEKGKFIKHKNFSLNDQENLNDCIEEILMGFKKSYKFLMKNKKEVTKFFNNTSSDFPIRFLYRNTFVYSHILYESLSPILLTNKNNRIDFIKQLEESLGDNANILATEVADLHNNDIPYYYCKINSTTIENKGGLSQNNFFEKSPYESLLYKLNTRISKRDLEHQLLLIKYSFAQNTSKSSNKVFKKRQIYDSVNLTYNFFKNIVGKSNLYFTLQESYKVPNQYNLEYSNNNLINGKIGDLLYLAEANKIFKNTQISKIISRLYKENIGHLENSEYLGMAGIGGKIFFLLRMHKIYNDGKYIDEAIKYLDSLDLMNVVEKSRNNGIIYGRAGLLISFIELGKQCNSSTINELIHFTYNQIISSAKITPDGLYWVSEFNKTPLSGVAHGISGIVLSLLRYFKAYKETECKNIIIKAILFENTFYNNENKNWKDNRSFISKELEYSSFGWSHGSPGIGLVRLELIEANIFSNKFLNILKKDLINCVESTFKNGLRGNDTLIFGNYGNSELLFRYSKYTNNFELLKKIQNILNPFDNLNFIKNNKGLIVPGMFNGISGCGYQLLYFNNYIKNSILTFECK